MLKRKKVIPFSQSILWISNLIKFPIWVCGGVPFGEMEANLKANGFDLTSGELPFFDRSKKIPFSSFPLSLSLKSKLSFSLLSIALLRFVWFEMVFRFFSEKKKMVFRFNSGPMAIISPKSQSKESHSFLFFNFFFLNCGTHQDWFVLSQFLENCSQFSLCKTVFYEQFESFFFSLFFFRWQFWK